MLGCCEHNTESNILSPFRISCLFTDPCLKSLPSEVLVPFAAGNSSSHSGHTKIPSNEECGIRDVWGHNLEEEFRTIRQVVQKYHYVAMVSR